jgi:hypothetical protein
VRRVVFGMVLLSVLLVLGCKTREQRLLADGNALIERINAFQRANHRLPENLGELGIAETEEGPLYYQKISSERYTVHFGTTVGESMIYRSDRRAWVDH